MGVPRTHDGTLGGVRGPKGRVGAMGGGFSLFFWEGSVRWCGTCASDAEAWENCLLNLASLVWGWDYLLLVSRFRFGRGAFFGIPGGFPVGLERILGACHVDLLEGW